MDLQKHVDKYGRYVRGGLKLASLVAGVYLAYRIGIPSLTLENVGALVVLALTGGLGVYFMR